MAPIILLFLFINLLVTDLRVLSFGSTSRSVVCPCLTNTYLLLLSYLPSSSSYFESSILLSLLASFLFSAVTYSESSVECSEADGGCRWIKRWWAPLSVLFYKHLPSRRQGFYFEGQSQILRRNSKLFAHQAR